MLALRIKKAVRKGATLVVADPRKIWLTKLAKRHLQLRPGTDVWLLNAMMHTILEEGLQNEEYIRDVTDDFEAVREIVMRYSPEDAEKITGVPAEDIRATAREYASEKHAGIFYTLGITEHACGVDNIWSLSNLVLMTGHLGYESTGLNALRGQNNVQGLNDSGANPSYLPGYQSVDDPEIRKKFSDAWRAEVPERPGYRLDQIVSGLHDGRIKALYLIGENPAQTEPNARHVEEGLEGLDFLMSQDIFLNDSSRKYAHVVLPASSFAEKDGTFTNTERRISRVRAAAPLPGEARVDREIVIEMAKALGAEWPEYPDAESVWNELADLSPNWFGIRYDRIEENGMQWPCTDLDHPGTPYLHAPRPALASGRGRFFPVEFQPPIEEPDSEYPFVLTTGRTLYHYNSANMTMREPGVTDKQQAPFFEIHAEDAGALGIADRQVARLVSRRGALEAEAHYSERVYPGLVWMSLHFAEQKVNWLTHDVGDPLIGTPEYKVSAVRVETLVMPVDRFGPEVAERYDERYAYLESPDVVDPIVDFLAEQAQGGSALELGVGTGRIALPLAARGVAVHGIDLSEAMVAELRTKPGAERLRVTIGDFSATTIDGTFSLAYLVANTIMNLTEQDDQVACFRNVAAHLEPGGRFVIEVLVPGLQRLPPGTTFQPFDVRPEHLGFDEIDVATQRLVSHHYWIEDGALQVVAPPFRYVWPSELDLMAQLAGMTLRERWGDWKREPFTSESTKHISVWEKP